MTQNITRNQKAKEELTLKDDLVFKAFFAKKGNEKYLKSFLEAVLNIKIQNMEVEQESDLYKLTIDQKPGRLDVQATIDDGKIIDIEMQVKDEKNIEQRTLYYGSRIISGQLERGEKYKQIKPVILINILNFNIFNVEEYHTQTITVLKEHKEYEVLKEVTYHFIELPKFRKAKPELKNMLECWLALIDNQKGGLVQMAEEKEKIIKEAKKEVEEIINAKELKEILEYRWSAQLDENSRIGNAMEEGLEKGMKKGIKQGIEQNLKKIAKEMLKENIDLETIMKCTKLSKKDLEILMQDKECKKNDS